MATIKESIDVEVPVSVAYNQWTQFEDFPQFMTGIVDVEQIDDKHVRWIAEVNGERRQWTAEILEQEPDRIIAWRSIEGTPNSGRVEFEPTDRGTHVSLEMEYEPGGIKESAGAVFGFDSRQVEEDLERFKQLIENREVPTGAWRGEIRSGRVVEGD